MGSGLTTLELFRLDRACIDVTQTFGHCTYLVGTAFDGASFRDVDVRTILSDDEFDALFANRPLFWSLVCMTISAYLADTTGLRVDYQIQRQTEANEKHDGPRNPLGLIVGFSGYERTTRYFAGLGDATRFRPPTPSDDQGAP